MSAREKVLATLREQLPELRERYGVCGLWLFGSVARGEDDEDSDVNLLAEFEGAASLFTLARLKRHLEIVLGRHVELGTPEGLSRASRDPIMKERILVA